MTSPGTNEQSINVALGEVLAGMRPGWRVLDERNGAIVGGGRADILVLDESGWPVVIEAERANYASAERDADARLGKQPVDSEHPIETAIALVYPPEFQQLSGEKLRKAIRATDALEYALYTKVVDDEREPERLPESGWLRGSVIDLAMLIHRAATPPPRVEDLANALAEGVDRAAKLFAFPYGSERGTALAGALNPGVEEEDQEERRRVLAKADTEQSRRMAMTVILNALVFHESLAEAEFRVPGDDGHVVPSVETFWDESTFQRTNLLDEWDAILERNYWPIFASAKTMLVPDVMPEATAARVVRRLWRTAKRLVQGGVTRSHDLTGTVFQRLIADRKFLATFYTRPEAAALLAGLALPAARPPGGADWADAKALANLQIGDFACGTGTLLSAAYSRLSLLHELHEGDPKALHRPMMAHGLYGLDVLPVAVHLTAAMLAGAQPDTPFDGECLLTMPYGALKDGSVAIGSLDLLAAEVQPGLIGQAAATTAGGRKPEDVRDLVNRVGHGRFDLVIMNPPFTRQGGQEADRKGIGNAAFAAFNTPRAVQDAMQAKLRAVSGEERLGSGHAGMAAHFTDLSMRKLRPGGSLALVLPLSAMSGVSWEVVRRALADRFPKIVVLTINASRSAESSFSADTGMAECLIVANDYSGSANQPARATFVVLRQQPPSTLWSQALGEQLHRLLSGDNVRRLEDGPVGATPISLGNEQAAYVIDCPLPDEGPWKLVGIGDAELAQIAYRLERGSLPILGRLDIGDIPVPITKIGDIATPGPYHLNIYATNTDGSHQGPFHRRNLVSGAPTYPMLWAHDTKKERQFIVAPDSEGQVKTVDARSDQQAINEKATLIWATATRAHYTAECRFNSQSLIVAMTERPCIGGRSWPSVIFENPEHEYAFALWSNSTLGLLLHWWTANKTQNGRGTTSVTSLPYIPTLDVRALSPEQHERARAAFEALRNERFLPFDQIYDDENGGSDPARARLDRALLVDVLGLPESLCVAGGPLETLRRKLAAEPQIHGGKRTRVIFTATGERTERRSDR